LEANHRCSHLQASFELQVNSLSVKEEQLTSEVSEWKEKYEKMEVNYKSQKVSSQFLCLVAFFSNFGLFDSFFL
jgi:hypothetical protein